jgi:hypothetical protein
MHQPSAALAYIHCVDADLGVPRARYNGFVVRVRHELSAKYVVCMTGRPLDLQLAGRVLPYAHLQIRRAPNVSEGQDSVDDHSAACIQSHILDSRQIR